MTENLSDTGVILEVLGDLELPILKPINKVDEGYELMLSYPKDKNLTKEFIKQELEQKGLTVVDIDAFREKTERYAWVIVVPNIQEEEIG